MGRRSTSLKRRLERAPPWVAPAVIVTSVGVAAYALGRILFGGRCDRSLSPTIPPPRAVNDSSGRPVPWAEGGCDPIWPVVSKHSRLGEVAYTDRNGTVHGNWARQFGAPRDGRRHAGIDLYGYHGDTVRAIEDGTVVAIQSFHLGTPALLVENDSGVVVLYGELEPGSPEMFGVDVGSRVEAGQPIAQIGCMQSEGGKCTSHMLHLETYVSGVTKNQQWHVGNNAPPALLDPTLYLLRASLNR